MGRARKAEVKFGREVSEKKGLAGGNCSGGERGGKYQRAEGTRTGGSVENRESSGSTWPCRHRVVCHKLRCARHILGAENKEARVCARRV